MALNNSKKIVIILILAVALVFYFGIRNFLEKCYYPPILMYHNIENVPQGGGLYVIPKQFEEQMKFLRDNKYNVISLDGLADMINSGVKIPHNIVAVTLDDGNANNYLNAFPILKKYKIPATMFVFSDNIGKGGHLTYLQMREMSKGGIEFGSHTKTHRNLKEATRKEMLKEVIQSKDLIEKITGKPVTTFCYPYGEKNVYGTEILKGAGFKAACVNMLRDNSVKLDPYALKRLKISTAEANIIVFRAKLLGYYTWFKARRWTKKK